MKHYLLCVISLSLPLFSADTGFQFFPDSVELIAKWDVSSTFSIEGFQAQFIDASKEEIDELISFGLDPKEDIEEVLFGLVPDKEEGNESSFLAIVRYSKKINLESFITKLAKKENQKVNNQEYQGVTLFNFEDEDPMFFTDQIDGEWSIIGSLSMVQRSIDLMNGKGTSVIQNHELMAACQDGLLPHLFWATGNLSSAGQGMDYQNVLFTVDYLNGLQVAGNIPFKSEEEKVQINQTLSMGTGLLMMLAQGKINPADIVIEERDSDIHFNVTIPDGLIQSLKEQAESMGQKQVVPQDEKPD